MRIVLNDINPDIVEAWTAAFTDTVHRKLEISCSDFRNLPKVFPADMFILATAGNSFGIMGGGLDLAIAQKFPGVEECIQNCILNTLNGELFIGGGLAIPLLKEYAPFVALIYTPTMIAPMALFTGKNVYLATRAALTTFRQISELVPALLDCTLVLPGFGGQCGRLDPKVIAKAMKLAIDNFLTNRMPRNTREMLAYAHEIGRL